jgi:hypothetical protein
MMLKTEGFRREVNGLKQESLLFHEPHKKRSIRNKVTTHSSNTLGQGKSREKRTLWGVSPFLMSHFRLVLCPLARTPLEGIRRTLKPTTGR